MRRQTNVNEIFLLHEKFSWPGGDHNPTDHFPCRRFRIDVRLTHGRAIAACEAHSSYSLPVHDLTREKCECEMNLPSISRQEERSSSKGRISRAAACACG